MKSTLPILVLTAFATSVFAIEQITATESCPAAAACTSCEAGCSCDKPCCQQGAAATAAEPACNATTATVASTIGTTANCGKECRCSSQCDCSTEVTAATTAVAATTSPCGENCKCCSECACTERATSAKLAATATTTACGESCQSCSECACSKQTTNTATSTCTPGTAAQWTATTTDFATIVADITIESSPCCGGDCQCPSACNEACTGSCSAPSAAELQRTGVDPYRVECPDVLTIYVPSLQTTCAEMRRELTARGILSDVQLPFVGKTSRQIVQPDGNIAIEDIGTVYVSGKTVEEARLAIMKKAFEANPQAARASFGVFVDVAAKNSKKAYIILDGGEGGDNVIQVPTTTETTVSSVLKKNAWPQPIDFASAKIWIARPGSNGARETVLPVTWNRESGQPTCETNHALLPSDRVFVRLESEQALPVPPPPVASIEFPVMPHPIRYYEPSAPAVPQAFAPIAFDIPAPPSVMRYSAIPAAAPSPFSSQPSVIQASPTSIAAHTYVVAPPAPQPPKPVPHPAITVARISPESSSPKGDDVEFAIAVIEDISGSFAQFPKLRDGIIMVSDSDTTLAAVRIMENQKLVKRISDPRLRCAVGEQATLSMASAADDEQDAGEAESFSVQVKAHSPGRLANGSHIFVDTGVRTTRGRQVHQVELSFQIEEGQTAVLKTAPQPRQGAKDGERQVYVVVTPKLVK